MTTIFLKSTFEEPSETVRAAALRGEVAITEQTDFTAEMLMSHKGLITGNQLDQNAMLALKDALASFLDHGGRWFFNGHMARPLVDGIGQYRSIVAPKRQDFGLSSINPHPLYDGIDLKKIETNRGVANHPATASTAPMPTACHIPSMPTDTAFPGSPAPKRRATAGVVEYAR